MNDVNCECFDIFDMPDFDDSEFGIETIHITG